MNRNLVVLSGIAVLLAAYSAYDWLGGAGPDAVVPAVAPAGGAAQGGVVKLNPLEGLSPESFAAVLERPLFNPGRAARPVEQPPPPPPPEQPPPPEPPQAAAPNAADYALLAVAGGPAGRIAAVRLTATGEVLYLREGQPIGEWSIVSVGDKSVVIGTPDANVTLNLFEATGANGAAPPMEEAPPPPSDQPPPEQPPPPGDAQAPAPGE